MAKFNFVRDEHNLNFRVAPLMIKMGRLLRKKKQVEGRTAGGIHVQELIEDLW